MKEKFKPETPFVVSWDDTMVYSLKEVVENSRRKFVQDETWICVSGPPEVRAQVAKIVMLALNKELLGMDAPELDKIGCYTVVPEDASTVRCGYCGQVFPEDKYVDHLHMTHGL